MYSALYLCRMYSSFAYLFYFFFFLLVCFFFVYAFYASLLQPSRKLMLSPEKKSSLAVPPHDTVQMKTVIGGFQKRDQML